MQLNQVPFGISINNNIKSHYPSHNEIHMDKLTVRVTLQFYNGSEGRSGCHTTSDAKNECQKFIKLKHAFEILNNIQIRISMFKY